MHAYIKNPTGIVMSEISPTRQSMVIMYTNNAIGASSLDDTSGTMCASVVSMLSIRSKMVFLISPLGRESTSPRDMRASLLQAFVRTSEMTVNVALCEMVVETMWQA